jgi:hypothetical protein
MVFQNLKIWQKDFYSQSFFLFIYFMKVITEKTAAIRHPKSYFEHLIRGEAATLWLANRPVRGWPSVVPLCGHENTLWILFLNY